MPKIDFDLLRKRITAGAREAFTQIVATHPEEKIYAFVLYAAPDATGIIPSANSEEADVAKRAENASDYSADVLLGEFRWSPYSWKYECDGTAFLDPASELLQDRYDDKEADGYVKFKAAVLASMVLALRDLVAEDFFASQTQTQANVTVFCSDLDNAPWLEADSGRRLNSPKVYNTFEAERIAYIAESPEDRAPKRDKVYAYYLAHLEHGSVRA